MCIWLCHKVYRRWLSVISVIFVRIDGPDICITWLDFGWFSSRPWPWIFKVKYGLFYISTNCHKNKSKHIIWTLGLKYDHRVSPWPWPWPNMEFFVSQPKMVRLPQDKKQTNQLNFRHQMWPMGFTLAIKFILNSQGQIWNLIYFRQKWFHCHGMKSKHIDWTLGLNCDQWVWPWPWPWSWIFMVKCDLDLWPAWLWPWIFMVRFYNDCILGIRGMIDIEQKGWESVMTMAMTFLWPK